jgi:D-methionine transport system permease protein
MLLKFGLCPPGLPEKTGSGLGDFAIRCGYQRYQTDVTVVTVIVLIVLVSIIQGIGSFFARRATH